MDKQKFPNLFSPITLANTVFRNRIFASATGPSDLNADLTLSPQTCAYYERKAIGGASAVCLGNSSVDTIHGRSMGSFVDLSDNNQLKGLHRLAGAISRHGSVPSMELTHAGSHAFSSFDDGNPIYGPIEYIDEQGRHILPATEEIIGMFIDQFAKAAAFAKFCGFGMVNIHGGHGWLITQFMSPVTNTRTDRWGGSPENRCRLAIEITKAVRKACGPGFPIEMRMSGSECNPGGYDLDEGIAIAKQLDGIVDIIHVSAGSHEVREVFTVTHPSMFLDDGANVKYAAEIRKHVKQSAVATVGALADPALMEEIIASGKADIVALARGLIADPDLPVKAVTGRDGEVRKCMRCLACFSNHIVRRKYLCAINPIIGNEMEDMWAQKPAKSKKVLVAGGGIAGMQAALTAAARGHEVVLCEKSDKLGGVLKCEQDVSFKRNLGIYIERQADAVEKAGVSIVLNTPVTPKIAEKYAPDVIIAAFGARPVVPGIKGIDGGNVFGAEDVYYDISKAGKHVVIIGGGLVGAELGIHLAMEGRKVDIVEVLPELSYGGNILHAIAIDIEIKKYDIGVHLNTEVLEITEEGIRTLGSDGNGQGFIRADTVIYAVGQEPQRAEADAIRFYAPEFFQIGDCLTPKNITEATSTAYHIALGIGRV